MVYVFGGQLLKDGSVSNELFWMPSERMEWHQQPTRGDRPVGRHSHVAVYDADHHQLVVFGGTCVCGGPPRALRWRAWWHRACGKQVASLRTPWLTPQRACPRVLSNAGTLTGGG